MQNITFDIDKLTNEELLAISAILRAKKAIVEYPEKNNKVWKPKLGEKYYGITITGEVAEDYWSEYAIDYELYRVGNCFAKEKAAIEASEKLKVIADLRRFAEENNHDGFDVHDCNTRKYKLAYDIHNDIIEAIYTYDLVTGDPVFFDSKAKAIAAAETVGRERIIKYYFGINE